MKSIACKGLREPRTFKREARKIKDKERRLKVLFQQGESISIEAKRDGKLRKKGPFYDKLKEPYYEYDRSVVAKDNKFW